MTIARNGNALTRGAPEIEHAEGPSTSDTTTRLAITDGRSDALGATAEVARQGDEPAEVKELRAQRDTARALVGLQYDPALTEALSKRERGREVRLAQKLRAGQRRERLRAGREQLAAARRVRSDNRWGVRARQARERLLNPDRRLASTYRRYVALSGITLALVVAGTAWMAVTVHHGLVGENGPWIAYLVEPTASLLLVVSMYAQFTAVEHGKPNPRWFLALDVGLVIASLVLNVVPWGLRYGFDAGSVIAHVLPPLLIAAAVAVHHMLKSLFGGIFADVHDELEDTLRLDETTADVLVLVERTRQDVRLGRMPLQDDGLPSIEKIRKTYGIGKVRAQLTRDALELLRTHTAAGTAAQTPTP
jgi:hypothetical protein